MSKRECITGAELGEKILMSLRQIKAGKTGRVTVIEPPETEASEARRKMGLSQAEFAQLLGVSARTLQDWEQGRREPSGAAKTLLKIAARRPEAVLEVRA
ncbi:MAG: helix-turn-helix domain-containing protein [Burkholderiales bacterium]|jgi:putative transcriptional regulator|nr:helix-turn-helix domain-containing protein [Burkholderiales bacterium]